MLLAGLAGRRQGAGIPTWGVQGAASAARGLEGGKEGLGGEQLAPGWVWGALRGFLVHQGAAGARQWGLRCRLQVANCMVQAARCKLHIANCTLQIARCRLLCKLCVAKCVLQVERCRLHSTWALQIVRCRLHVANRAPQPASQPARCRLPCKSCAANCTLQASL